MEKHTRSCSPKETLMLTDQIYIRDEIKNILNLENACYRAAQTLLIKYNFAPFLYGCETWPLTLRKEHRLSMYENMVPEEYLGLRGMN
jgi:hypothetical protein